MLHVRHASWCDVLKLSAKRRLEIVIFEVLTTTRVRTSKSFVLCLYMITIRAKQAKVHQHGIIAKHLTQSSILM